MSENYYLKMHVQDGTIVKYGGVFIKGDLISWENKNRNTAAIGVFDSGVGGLTVHREIMRQLPNENVVYFGDTARVPYGSKSKNNIIRFSRQIIRFLKTKNVKAIVIACNTASALALETVKEEFDIPIIGVIVPGARAAVRETKNGQIGVLGTEATIKSETYTKEIRKLMPEAEVIGKPCPLFVPLVEEGFAKHKITEEVIDIYLSDMRKSEIDTLILGCTHYPLLRSRIMAYFGEVCTYCKSGVRDSDGFEADTGRAENCQYIGRTGGI